MKAHRVRAMRNHLRGFANAEHGLGVYVEEGIDAMRAKVERLRARVVREESFARIERMVAIWEEGYCAVLWVDPRKASLQLLGLTEGYTKADAKRAYRKASLKHHPDKGGSAEAFHRVTDAYEFLTQ